MSPTTATVLSALVTTVGVVTVALITYRQNRKGAAATNALTERIADTEDKKVDLSVLQASIADLTGRLGRVEEELAHERSQRKLSNAYARTLASVLRDHQMEVPAPPPELDLP